MEAQAGGKERSIIIRVRRSHPGRWQEFRVPYEPGQTVLDGLRWAREHVDPSLAVFFSCGIGVCKTCVARIDGRADYQCTCRLSGEAVTVEPLVSRPLVRDLVVHLAPRDRLASEAGGLAS